MKTDKLAAILAKLPEVQKMVENEETDKRNQAIKARMKCLAKLQQLEKASILAQQKQELAAKRLEDARAALRPLEAEAIKAGEEANELSRLMGRTYQEWTGVHGEGHVLHAMYLMNLQREHLEHKKANYESNSWQYKGKPWARRSPRVMAMIADVNEKLAALNTAYSELLTLQCIEATPEELRRKVQALTDRADITGPNKDKAQNFGALSA